MRSTTFIPWPSRPTSAPAPRRARENRMPLISAPRIPWVRSRGKGARPPDAEALSTRKIEKASGPPSGSVRAKSDMVVPRVALLMHHFVPSTIQPSPSRAAATSQACKSPPCASSVRARQPASPERSFDESRARCSGVPAIQTGRAPRNDCPVAMARLRSRRATRRPSTISSSSARSLPPSASGTRKSK